MNNTPVIVDTQTLEKRIQILEAMLVAILRPGTAMMLTQEDLGRAMARSAGLQIQQRPEGFLVAVGLREDADTPDNPKLASLLS